MNSQKVVTPVKLVPAGSPPKACGDKLKPGTGVQVFTNGLKILDSGFRRNDEETPLEPSYETIMFSIPQITKKV
jgi:hypothetical protein